MPLTEPGRGALTSRLINDGAAVPFDAANARIGVGDGSTAFAVTQGDLTGGNKLRKVMDGGFPIRTDNALTFKSTYTGTEANYAWNEWGVFNSPVGDFMLNRVVEYNGTKLVGQTWVFQVTVTITIGA